MTKPLLPIPSADHPLKGVLEDFAKSFDPMSIHGDVSTLFRKASRNYMKNGDAEAALLNAKNALECSYQATEKHQRDAYRQIKDVIGLVFTSYDLQAGIGVQLAHALAFILVAHYDLTPRKSVEILNQWDNVTSKLVKGHSPQYGLQACNEAAMLAYSYLDNNSEPYKNLMNRITANRVKLEQVGVR